MNDAYKIIGMEHYGKSPRVLQKIWWELVATGYDLSTD
jgi:hypothetical protein